MKFIWFTLLGAIIIFGIIYQMNKVAPTPMPGLTTNNGQVVGSPASDAPSDSNFEPLDLSENNSGLIIKSANAGEVKGANEALSKTALHTLGDENAPVKMYVFSSLTCTHCAAFHTKVLKNVEKKYVDTGKVFFTYVDFPFDSRALAGAMLTRCVAPDRYFTFLNVLFENQKEWAFKPNATEIVSTYASLQGLSKGDVRACLADKTIQQSIIKNRNAFAEKYQINSTPTTVIVKGDKTEIVVGAREDELEKALQKMIK